MESLTTDERPQCKRQTNGPEGCFPAPSTKDKNPTITTLFHFVSLSITDLYRFTLIRLICRGNPSTLTLILNNFVSRVMCW